MRIKFDTTECGRCGGSGRYSYSQTNGSVCFGCKGSGKKYTDKGSCARAAYRSQLMDYLGVTADSLIPGNIVSSRAWGGVMGGNDSPEKNRMIESIKTHVDGRVVLKFRGGMSYGYEPDELVRIVGDGFAPIVREIMRDTASQHEGATVSD